MSLGYDTFSALPFLRAQAESRFTESLVFFTAVDGTDPETLAPSSVETVVGSTLGRVKFTDTQGRDVESGAQYPVVARNEVHVGVGTVDVSVGVFVRVAASTVDDGLVGRVFRISDRQQAGQTTAWRYPVEAVS